MKYNIKVLAWVTQLVGFLPKVLIQAHSKHLISVMGKAMESRAVTDASEWSIEIQFYARIFIFL